MYLKLAAVLAVLPVAASAAPRSVTLSLPSRVLGQVEVAVTLSLNALPVAAVECGMRELGDTGDGISEIRPVRALSQSGAGTLSLTVNGDPAVYPVATSARIVGGEEQTCRDLPVFDGPVELWVAQEGGRGFERQVLVSGDRYLYVSVQQPRLDARASNDAVAAVGGFRGAVHVSVIRVTRHADGRSSTLFEEHLTPRPFVLEAGSAR
ncbi:MAG: hypothetical protein SF051_09485 [Elusimicrobiota bacterium]|nr:hypothetical protein [Elusimicrobiota bacterium]